MLVQRTDSGKRNAENNTRTESQKPGVRSERFQSQLMDRPSCHEGKWESGILIADPSHAVFSGASEDPLRDFHPGSPQHTYPTSPHYGHPSSARAFEEIVTPHREWDGLH